MRRSVEFFRVFGTTLRPASFRNIHTMLLSVYEPRSGVNDAQLRATPLCASPDAEVFNLSPNSPNWILGTAAHRSKLPPARPSMLRCPVCRREIRVISGTFPCEWCGEKLSWELGLTYPECCLLGFLIFFIPYGIAVLKWPSKPWLWLLIVLLLDIPLTVLFIWVRIWFFPSEVKRYSGWADDGTIPHITTPPEPPKDA
jgi:hypothetical protein